MAVGAILGEMPINFNVYFFLSLVLSFQSPQGSLCLARSGLHRVMMTDRLLAISQSGTRCLGWLEEGDMQGMGGAGAIWIWLSSSCMVFSQNQPMKQLETPMLKIYDFLLKMQVFVNFLLLIKMLKNTKHKFFRFLFIDNDLHNNQKQIQILKLSQYSAKNVRTLIWYII